MYSHTTRWSIDRSLQYLFGLFILGLLLILRTDTLFSAAPALLINEVLVDNTATNVDPDYTNFETWIEIYNAGSTTINLKGYTLTDTLSNPTQWKVTRDTNIQPGEYVLFWADKNDRYNHTNFSLKHKGEAVGLFAPDGTLVDSIVFGVQVRDVSYGRVSDGASSWGYFSEPTPASANNTPSLPDTDQTAEPQFSKPNGFYNSGISVSITSPESNAIVTYTLDGTDPTESSPRLPSNLQINDTTVVRAKSFETGKLASPTITHTYFIGESSTLPIFSLVTDPDYFFDDKIGIYVVGTNGIVGGCIDYPANWNQDWERPISLEFFEADGSFGFQFDSGVELQGGCTRRKPIKSLDVKLDDKYGTSEITYDLFPGYHINNFKAFLLRSSGNDQTRTMFRDGMVQTIIDGQMDVDKQAYRPAVLFLNGEYWGIHNIREKLNDEYIISHHGEDDVDLIKNRWEVKEGDLQTYVALERYIKDHDLANDTYYNYVASQIDIDEYINYQIAEIYSGNFDWPGNNIRIWRPRQGDAQWRWMFYDLDISWTSASKNSMTWATDPNAPKDWSTLFLRNLLRNQTFRNEFIQRFASHINITYDAGRVLPIIEQLRTVVAPEIQRHYERWRTPSASAWANEVAILRTYAQQRPNYMREDIEGYFNLSGQQSLTIHTVGDGNVFVNGVKVPTSNYSGPYFKGVPIRLSAEAAPGQTFVRWEGLGVTNPETLVTLNGALTVSAVFSGDAPPSTATPTATATVVGEPTATATQVGEPTATATPVVSTCADTPGNVIANPSFENGVSSWSYSPGSSGFLSIGQPGTHCDQAITVQIRTTDRNAQFFQRNVALKPATTYEIRFDAYASTAHTVRLDLLRHTSPYTPYGLKETIALTPGWQSFVFTFTTTGFNNAVTDGRLRFKLNSPATNSMFWFDNMVLVEQGGVALTATPTAVAPTPTSTPSSGPTATPTATPDGEPGVNPVRNGDFEAGTAEWKFYSANGGQFSAETASHDGSTAASLTIKAPSSNIQLYQSGIALKANSRYRLSFDATSASGHDFKVYLHKHSSPFTNYGINSVRFDITADWQQFSYEFTTTGFSGEVSNARLRIWLSGMAGSNDQYWIDNIVLEQITP